MSVRATSGSDPDVSAWDLSFVANLRILRGRKRQVRASDLRQSAPDCPFLTCPFEPCLGQTPTGPVRTCPFCRSPLLCVRSWAPASVLRRDRDRRVEAGHVLLLALVIALE